jgi:hypothetical protein
MEVHCLEDFLENFLQSDASIHRMHWLVDFYLMLEHHQSCILGEEIGPLVLQILHHYCVHNILVKDILITRLGHSFFPCVQMFFHLFK